MISLLRAQVQSWVWELKSHQSCGMTIKLQNEFAMPMKTATRYRPKVQLCVWVWCSRERSASQEEI